MLLLFIEIIMAQLILRNFLSNVVTVLTCISCSVQAANAIFMVSLLICHITQKYISLIFCVSMFYVQNCLTHFDSIFVNIRP
jgi:hypothetical protein